MSLAVTVLLAKSHGLCDYHDDHSLVLSCCVPKPIPRTDIHTRLSGDDLARATLTLQPFALGHLVPPSYFAELLAPRVGL